MVGNLMGYISEIYSEGMFLSVVIGSLTISGLSVIVFTIPYTILDLVSPDFVRRYRRQKELPDRSSQAWRSLKFFGLNFGILVIVSILAWPALREASFYSGILPSWWMVILQIIFFLFIDDFLFYWYHRLLHRPWFYRNIHSVHHAEHSPIALTSLVFHPAEYLLISLSVMIGPVIVGAHVYVLYIWIIIRQWIAIEGHSGYDFPIQLLRIFPFHDGSTFHARHHEDSRTNYGVFYNYLDRLFGTYSGDKIG
jgi:4-alpha-methyl-delta7-sterol-4alpha-methyl oxidase